MREALLRELEDEYCLLRNANEREENNRRNRIRKELPDLERLLRLHIVIEQVGHDRVTRTDDLRDRAGTVFDQIGGVADPNISTV